MTIERAWCAELGRSVSIDEARREIVAGTTGAERFTFYCSHEPCRAKGIRVSGVNYWRPAQEAEKYRAAHFREKDEHIEGCEWRKPDAVERVPSDAHCPDGKPHQARRKLNDWVNVFDPRGTDEICGNADESAATDVTRAVGGSYGERGSNASGTHGETRTNSLERLVDLYLEAKSILSWEEFQNLEIQVIGVGMVRLANYFQRLGQPETADRVVYGGARLLKRYGLGFKFRFYDTVSGKTIHLYISNDEMSEYRHRRYLDALLKHVDTVRYFTLYAIGEMHPATHGESMELIVRGLHHLVVILGPSRNDAGDSESSTRNVK